MKKSILGIFIGILVLGLGTSCKKYLDVNTDPNRASSVTPQLILPQAITYTAAVLNGYNSYGAQTGLYCANAGGYGGFGESITYNYTTTGTGTWGSTYDNLEDYQTVLNTSAGNNLYSYFSAAARIMKVLNFQLLVDTYNDVPYVDALKGSTKLNPTYTAGKDIYKDLASQLDTAIAEIAKGDATPGVTPLGSSDVLFGGNTTKWKQFANTLKLRIIVRGNGKVPFSNTTFSADGFLTTDALITLPIFSHSYSPSLPTITDIASSNSSLIAPSFSMASNAPAAGGTRLERLLALIESEWSQLHAEAVFLV